MGLSHTLCLNHYPGGNARCKAGRVGGDRTRNGKQAGVAFFGALSAVSLGLCPDSTQTRATGMENVLSNLCGRTAGPQTSPHPLRGWSSFLRKET